MRRVGHTEARIHRNHVQLAVSAPNAPACHCHHRCADAANNTVRRAALNLVSVAPLLPLLLPLLLPSRASSAALARWGGRDHLGAPPRGRWGRHRRYAERRKLARECQRRAADATRAESVACERARSPHAREAVRCEGGRHDAACGG